MKIKTNNKNQPITGSDNEGYKRLRIQLHLIRMTVRNSPHVLDLLVYLLHANPEIQRKKKKNLINMLLTASIFDMDGKSGQSTLALHTVMDP